MREPTFLLQAGEVMPIEKIACNFSSYPSQFCKFDDIPKLNPEEAKLKFVPVGSVEFTRAYCDHVGLGLPTNLSYPEEFHSYLYRNVQEGLYKEASFSEFVKPLETKTFTGNIKLVLEAESPDSIDPETPVWISEPVTFESEFRFYIHDFVTGGKIQGWARYDGLSVTNPEPDFNLVESIMDRFHRDIGPGAYSIDVGWRPHLNCYSLVEINDGWSLGLYNPTDPQSNPPTMQQYADMLVSRWTQILFCNIV